MRAWLSALVVFACSAPAWARATPARAATPWFLQVSHSQRDSSVAMGWQLRWQGLELLSTPRALADGLGAAMRAPESSLRGLLTGTRFNFFGVRLRPFRQDAPAATAPSGAAASGSQAAAEGRLRFKPVIDELKQQGRRDLRRWVVNSVFDQVLPQARSAAGWQKETVVRDVTDGARSWDAHPLDGLAESFPY